MKIKYYYNDKQIKEKDLPYYSEVTVKMFIDKKLIGNCSYIVDNTLFYFHDFLIKKKYRKLGYGTIIVNILNSIANKYYSDIEKVVHCNEKSIGIFRKLGFIEKETYTILTKK